VEGDVENSSGPHGASTRPENIDLRCPLSLRNAWRFPLQSPESRHDVFVGGLWLLVPIVGWLMNMGHRIRVVHRMHHGRAPWPAWDDPRDLLKHGAITFLGMAYYGAPGVALVALGWWTSHVVVAVLGIALWTLAVIAIPGYMSHYCRELDPREIFDPFRALRRVSQGGLAYFRAWSIVLPTMVVSFLGLLGLGVGFAFTSVWFWQVAAFCFATVFTQRFDLDERAPPPVVSRS
jgi:hypothetical protein